MCPFGFMCSASGSVWTYRYIITLLNTRIYTYICTHTHAWMLSLTHTHTYIYKNNRQTYAYMLHLHVDYVYTVSVMETHLWKYWTYLAGCVPGEGHACVKGIFRTCCPFVYKFKAEITRWSAFLTLVASHLLGHEVKGHSILLGALLDNLSYWCFAHWLSEMKVLFIIIF